MDTDSVCVILMERGRTNIILLIIYINLVLKFILDFVETFSDVALPVVWARVQERGDVQVHKEH